MNGKYRQRYTEEDMRRELIDHFKAIPTEQAELHIQDAAARKAANYVEALRHLDDALARVSAAAERSTDPEVRAAAEFAARKITEAVDAYGEASLVKNNSWGDGTGT